MIATETVIQMVEKGMGTSPIDSSDKPSDLPPILADAKLWLDAENIDGEGNADLENEILY